MARRDYYYDPDAPPANSLVPGASAVVVDDQDRIVLQRRTDNDLWALPGGTMDIGESITDTARRETLEETGLTVDPLYVIGVYSNPHHVFAYDDGEIRQEFSVCFACRVLDGELRASDESHEVAAFREDDLDGLAMHESIRLRIRHYLERRPQAVMA